MMRFLAGLGVGAGLDACFPMPAQQGLKSLAPGRAVLQKQPFLLDFDVIRFGIAQGTLALACEIERRDGDQPEATERVQPGCPPGSASDVPACQSRKRDALGRSRVAVALKVATTGRPGARPSRSADAAVR